VSTALAGPVGAARLRWAQLWRLAWHDVRHERWLAFCAACVLAATLAPLATLWGLEHGVIGTLIERQDQDPLMREVQPEASGVARLDAAWFERVRRWPQVAFVTGTVRSSAALVELVSDDAPAPVALELRPTAPGDPLLAGRAPPSGAALVLSAEAARQLNAKKGQPLAIPFKRIRDGNDERAAVRVVVADVLPLAVSDGGHALAAPPFVEAIEQWRDGYRVEGYGFGDAGSGPPPARVVYPLFRMYATSIREVQALKARLEAEGISVRVRDREIASTLGLQRNLRAVLGLVAAVTLAGAIVALSALQIATVRRKRREYALLKLTGHGRSWLVLLPCLHALAIALAGAALAFVVYRIGAALINSHFAAHLAPGEAAVRLGSADLAAGVLAAALVSMLPAVWGGWRASNVEAADELREQ
jgi:putative ABC transport system permease protein